VISVRANSNEIKKLLKKVEKDEIQKAKTSLKASLVVGAGRASQNAPVDTGTLRQSIDSRITDTKGLDGEIFTGIKYAKFQNNGTSRIRGKRFMEKGIRYAQQVFIKLMKR
jgi:HK97 gp10 family phage protein